MNNHHGLLKVVRKGELILLWLCCLSLLLGTLALTFVRLGDKSAWQLVTVTDAAMGSAVPKHSLAIVKRPIDTQVSQGQLVSFAPPGRKDGTIIRRIERIVNDNGERLIVTKADANPGVDTWLLTDRQIRGQYRGHLAAVGSWLEYLKSPVGTVALVIIPGLLIISFELRRLFSTMFKRSEKSELVASSV